MIDPREFAQMDAIAHQYYDQTHPPTPTAQAKPKASGNFLTHLLPTVGGTGGAIGGAAIGTALLPGIGTLAGALLGGALGGGASKVGENAIEHQKLGSGVAGQAIEQGVLGAGPLRLAKAATFGTKAALGAAKAGGGLEAALSAANDKIATSGVKNQLLKTGNGLKQEATGIKAGATAPGSSVPLRPSKADQLQQYLDTVSGAKNSAHTQARAVEGDVKNTGQGIQSLLQAHDGPISPAELQTVHAAGEKAAGKALGLSKDSQLIADTQNQINGSADSLSKLRDVRSNIDDTLKNFYKQTDRNSATTAEMKVMKGYRDGIDKLLSSRIPGFKELNTRYANGINALDFLGKNANPSGFRVFGVQTHVGGEGLQATKDALGRGLTKVAGKSPAPVEAGASDATSAGIPGLTPGAIASRTVPFGALSAAGSGLSQPATTADTSQPGQPQQPQDLTSALMGAQGLGQDTQAQQPTSQNPYSQENLMADIQRDPKHADQYISTYASLDKIFNPPSTTKPLNSTQQQQAFNAQSGLDSLGEIANVLQQNPNAAKLASIPGGSLAANLTHTGSYQAAINNATDVIGRLRSGGAIGQQEEIQFKKLLPAFGDNPDTINYKLQQLSHVFQQFANPQASQPGSSDLTSALMQAGYGQ